MQQPCQSRYRFGACSVPNCVHCRLFTVAMLLVASLQPVRLTGEASEPLLQQLIDAIVQKAMQSRALRFAPIQRYHCIPSPLVCSFWSQGCAIFTA